MNIETPKKATVTFESEGHEVKMEITTLLNHELNVQITAKNPSNLKEHRGMHVRLANMFVQTLQED